MAFWLSVSCLFFFFPTPPHSPPELTFFLVAPPFVCSPKGPSLTRGPFFFSCGPFFFFSLKLVFFFLLRFFPLFPKPFSQVRWRLPFDRVLWDSSFFFFFGYPYFFFPPRPPPLFCRPFFVFFLKHGCDPTTLVWNFVPQFSPSPVFFFLPFLDTVLCFVVLRLVFPLSFFDPGFFYTGTCNFGGLFSPQTLCVPLFFCCPPLFFVLCSRGDCWSQLPGVG